MRKNVIIALLLTAMLLPSLASCGDSSAAQETSSAADTTVQETEKETTAEEARNAISKLGLKLETVADYPLDDTAHTVLVLRKINPTPPQYPRRFAKIKQSPL